MSGKSRRRRAARARKAAKNKDRAETQILARVFERSSPARATVPMARLAFIAVILAISTIYVPIFVVLLLSLLGWMAVRVVVSRSAPAEEHRSPVETDKIVRATSEGLWLAEELIPRAEIQEAYAAKHDTRGRQSIVVHRLHGPTLELRLPRGVEASPFLDALMPPTPLQEPAPALDPLPDTTPLRRRDRALDAWVASLHAIGSGDNAGPRTAPILRERLIRILAEPTADTADRAAAAVALARGMNDMERAELRVSARDAEPRLRVVLEHVANEAEDAVLAEALEEAGSR